VQVQLVVVIALLCGVCAGQVVDMTAAMFDSEVAREGSGGVDNEWVIEFYAPWCGVCKRFTPVFTAAAASVAKNPLVTLKFAKVNADEELALSSRFLVASIPAVFHVKNGKEVRSISPPHSQDDLISYFTQQSFLATDPWDDFLNPFSFLSVLYSTCSCFTPLLLLTCFFSLSLFLSLSLLSFSGSSLYLLGKGVSFVWVRASTLSLSFIVLNSPPFFLAYSAAAAAAAANVCVCNQDGVKSLESNYGIPPWGALVFFFLVSIIPPLALLLFTSPAPEPSSPSADDATTTTTANATAATAPPAASSPHKQKEETKKKK